MVKLDMCAFGMSAKGPDGVEGLVKKPTTMMTNSNEVARRISKKCSNSGCTIEAEKHEHVQLIGGRAAQAQVYPRSLCRAVCEGVAAQKRADSLNLVALDVMDAEELDAIGNDELHDEDPLVGYEAFYDVSGAELIPELVYSSLSEC